MVIQKSNPTRPGYERKAYEVERERGREGLDLNSNFVLAVEGG